MLKTVADLLRILNSCKSTDAVMFDGERLNGSILYRDDVVDFSLETIPADEADSPVESEVSIEDALKLCQLAIDGGYTGAKVIRSQIEDEGLVTEGQISAILTMKAGK